MKKDIVIYPGTFDPITFGHVDLVERAVRLFEQVIVAIGKNSTKSSLFSSEARIDLTKQVFQKVPQVKVMEFSNLLVDFARENNASTILRGLRVISDFDYEFRMANANRLLAPEIETLFLIPSERYDYVSSGIVREIAMLGGDVSQFVPPVVVKALKKVTIKS